MTDIGTEKKNTVQQKKAAPKKPAANKAKAVADTTSNAAEVDASAVITSGEAKQAHETKPSKDKRVKVRKFKRDDEILVTSNNPTAMGFVSRVNPSVRVFWHGVGSEQWLEYEYLLEMAGRQQKFFKQNWISVDDDVLVSLHMDKYYQNALSVDEYENIFSVPIEVMREKLSNVPDGQKRTLRMYAKQLVEDGVIDSKSRIKAIEEVLDCDLSDA